MKETVKRIIFTGGHAATTALAVIEEFIRAKKKEKWEIYWIGSESAVEGKMIPSLESEVFPKLGVYFMPIVAGRLQRRFTKWTLFSFLKIPLGFIHAVFLLFRIRPLIIISFGGFASVPVVVIGWILRIPIIIHEQTIVAGRANQFGSFFARKIALAREQSLKYFPKNKSLVIGNPILTQIAEVGIKEKLSHPPVILIMGGSRGAQIINDLINPILERLLTRYYLIHLVGYLDYEKFKKRKMNLPKNIQNNYELFSRISPLEIDNVYRQADLVISRAGANTVSELIIIKRPAILIPIPWTYLDEQQKNAEFAKETGYAEVLDQENWSEDKLLFGIEKIIKNYSEIIESLRDKKSSDKEAAKRMVLLIEEVCG